MGLKRLKHERISFFLNVFRYFGKLDFVEEAVRGFIGSSSLFEQADVELAQITLFTRSMLAICTATQGA